MVPPSYQPKSKFSPVQTCLVASGVAGCGCLFWAALTVFTTGAGILGFFGDAVKSTGSYQSYQMAETRLMQDAQVRELLGAPIDVGWFSKSQEKAEDGQSQVCMRVSVTGQNNSGTAYLETKREGDRWQWHQLILSVNDQANPVILEAPDGEALCPDFDTSEEAETTYGPIEAV